MPKITLLVPLRNRNFRYLTAGEIVSDLGDWLDFLAIIALIVYRWGLGPTALAAFSVATVLPRVVLAPVAGVLADRLDRRTVMIAADLARVPVVLAMVFAPNLTTLLALVVLKGCFSTFFTPAWQATIRATVPEEDLLAANSLSQLSLQMTKVLGPALGGVLVAVSGPRAAFVADAVSSRCRGILVALAGDAARAGNRGGRTTTKFFLGRIPGRLHVSHPEQGLGHLRGQCGGGDVHHFHLRWSRGTCPEGRRRQ